MLSSGKSAFWQIGSRGSGVDEASRNTIAVESNALGMGARCVVGWYSGQAFFINSGEIRNVFSARMAEVLKVKGLRNGLLLQMGVVFDNRISFDLSNMLGGNNTHIRLPS